MSETVLFESESRQPRAEVAAYLRRVADSLDAGDPITLSAGDESVTVEPPERPAFEVNVEREGPEGGPGEIGLEFELEWDERDGNGGDGEADGSLQIE